MGAFNDQIKRMVPKYNPKTDYYKDFGMKLLSGGLAGGLANVVCYPFDFARTRLASDLGKGEGQFTGIGAAFVCATVARTITTPFNYPFDTIRRRMMLDSDKPAEERLYKSAIDCFVKLSKNEGAAGMCKGLIPELFRGLGGPLVLTAYDRIKLILLG